MNWLRLKFFGIVKVSLKIQFKFYENLSRYAMFNAVYWKPAFRFLCGIFKKKWSKINKDLSYKIASICILNSDFKCFIVYYFFIYVFKV